MLRRERVRDVAKVDAADELLGPHVRKQLPERLALAAGVKVPDRVDDSGRGQVDHALLGAEPAKLRVPGHVAPEAAGIGREALERLADDQRRERFDSGDADLGAPADGEGEAVPALSHVGLERDVGERVVGIRVHRVRAGQRARRRKADVARLHPGDPHRAVMPPSTTITPPITEPASSEARYAAIAAISSALTKRPWGWRSSMALRASAGSS